MEKLLLSQGETAYEIVNEIGTKTHLFFHGGTLPSWAFDYVFEHLSPLGHRLIRYDMYGLGQSSTPKASYDMKFYVAQAEELLQKLNIHQVHSFVGSSFGASVATYLALKRPDLTKKLVYISPAINWKQNNNAVQFLTGPFLGALLYRFIGKRLIRKRALQFLKTLPKEMFELYFDKVNSQFRLDNHDFWYTLLQKIKSDALGNHKPAYKKLGKLKQHSIFAISGGQDNEVPLNDIDFLDHIMPNIDIEIIDRATHGLQAEYPDQLNDFLKRILSSA